jgi:hypothetical protein
MAAALVRARLPGVGRGAPACVDSFSSAVRAAAAAARAGRRARPGARCSTVHTPRRLLHSGARQAGAPRRSRPALAESAPPRHWRRPRTRSQQRRFARSVRASPRRVRPSCSTRRPRRRRPSRPATAPSLSLPSACRDAPANAPAHDAHVRARAKGTPRVPATSGGGAARPRNEEGRAFFFLFYTFFCLVGTSPRRHIASSAH